MTMDEKIARINALAHKAKAEGLTDEEKEEQAQLRRDYIDSVKANLKSLLIYLFSFFLPALAARSRSKSTIFVFLPVFSSST